MGSALSGRKPSENKKFYTSFAIEIDVKAIYDNWCNKTMISRTRLLAALTKYIPNAIKDLQEKTRLK